jgi:hypothetical protein
MSGNGPIATDRILVADRRFRGITDIAGAAAGRTRTRMTHSDGLPPSNTALRKVHLASMLAASHGRRSPNGTLWNVGSDHSGLMLANLMTFAHFSTSAVMKV